MVNGGTAHHLQTGTAAQDAHVHTTGASFRATAFIIMRYSGAAEHLSAGTAAKKAQIETAAAETKGVLKSKKVFKIALVITMIVAVLASAMMFIGCTPKENGGNGGTEIVTPITPDKPVVDQPIDNGNGQENQGGEIGDEMRYPTAG